MSKTKEKAQDAETVTQEIVPQQTFATMPTTVQEAIKLSEMIAASDLAPKDFKGKPGNCYIAIQMGAEVGLSPMQAIQNIAVINGRPTLFGDIGKALLLSRGCRIMERDIKDVRAQSEAWCEITRPDGKTKAIRTFSILDAKESHLWGKAGPWTEYPYRQMMWRAFWFCARDIAADYLKGLGGAEEVRDYVETELVTPVTAPSRLSDKRSGKDDPEAQSEASDGGTASDPASDHPQDQPEGEEALKLPKEAHWVPMKSKKEGGCENCADEIMVGDPIFWDPKKGRAHHQGHFK